uniref:AIP3 domain-containing protein n=1 Tax=Caenorhabditis japonica TaxID=281687 RepID=A0A8R1E1J6_CAEJA
MPGGLFSWRPRILGGRKTPEPSQAMAITIAPEPPEIPESPNATLSQQRTRNVRFDEGAQPAQQNYQKRAGRLDEQLWWRGKSDWNGTSGRLPPPDEPTNDWRYADDVKVRVAPIEVETPRKPFDNMPPQNVNPSRFVQPQTRANSVLQNLREQKEHLEYDDRRREVSTLPNNYAAQNRQDMYGTIQRNYDAPSRSDSSHIPALDDMNVVFLQANDEVKRTLLPRNIMSMHQVKMSFVRTFPNVNRSFVEQPHVKIYIQEPTKGALFYELEDPNDIKNKSVLRLREKTRVTSPIGYLNEPDYHSETEQDDGRRLVPLIRPASAMAAPVRDFLQQKQQQLAAVHQPTLPNYDIYSDPYNSDTSSHDSRSATRSGSATPVIDRESRVRMETMERQLAGLSNLVHIALVSKGMSETTQRDMAELRREILSMHPDTARDTPEKPPSPLSESSISSHTAFQLAMFRNKLQQTYHELKQMKNTAQVNAQTGNTLLREAGDKIEKIITDRFKGAPNGATPQAPSHAQREKPDEQELSKEIERNEHASRLAGLLHSLTNFETNVETVRGSVLSNQKKLRMSEVEDMTAKLTNIGRLAADLKTEFPPIQLSIEERIKRDMERVVREEKFIRDQNTAVDQSLRRCKALANIMVTMKKLAMVQDPTIQRRSRKSEGLEQQSPRLPPKPSATLLKNPHLQQAQLQNSPIQEHTVQNHIQLPLHLQNQNQNQNYPQPPTPPHLSLQQSLQSQLTPSIPPPPPPPPPPAPAVFAVAPPSTLGKFGQTMILELQQKQHQQQQQQQQQQEKYLEETKSPISMLDNVLEEVGEPGGPTRPSSRYPVQDLRPKYPNGGVELPDQLRNIIEDVARRASPGPESDRRQDLEERQERLAEKQRQLRSQFQQLQQLAPMP